MLFFRTAKVNLMDKTMGKQDGNTPINSNGRYSIKMQLTKGIFFEEFEDF